MIHELFVPKGRNDARRACRIGMSGSMKEMLFVLKTRKKISVVRAKSGEKTEL